MILRKSDPAYLALVCLGLTLVSPLLVFVAVVGTRAGLWGWAFGYETLTLIWAWGGAWLGGVAAFAAIGIAFRAPKAAGLYAGLAVGVAAVTLALFLPQVRQSADDVARSDVSSDPADPPAFQGALADQRRADGAALRSTARNATCVVASVPRQTAPGAAAYALEAAGFDVLGFGVGRADGSLTGFWFGFTHDATIRIRPGRTDVRVASREVRDDGGEACRLARKIATALSA